MDDLIYNNKNQAKLIRDMILNMDNYDSEEILNSILPLENSIDVGKYIGVIFQNPFSILELKIALHLFLDEIEEALELLTFSDTKLSKIMYEIIMMENENLQFEDFKEGLFDIFGETLVQKALNILAGDDFFIDTTFHKEYENILNLYDTLAKYKTIK